MFDDETINLESDISDEVKQEAKESIVDGIEAGHEVTTGDSVSPRDTPAVEQDQGGQER